MLLIANDGRRFMHFDLTPLGERHWEWHGYRITLVETERGEAGRLEATKGSPLFLDREVTPEIPVLCEGLERVLEGELFLFTPIDEGGFELSTKRSVNGVVVQLQARHAPFLDETGWPAGVEVSTAAIRRFIMGLRLEYEQIMACLPLR